jgi:hypothetical protein
MRRSFQNSRMRRSIDKPIALAIRLSLPPELGRRNLRSICYFFIVAERASPRTSPQQHGLCTGSVYTVYCVLDLCTVYRTRTAVVPMDPLR